MIERLWWRQAEPRAAEALLWPLSLCALGYRAGAALHRGLARPARAPLPVISVGNLTVGGAGKTPVVIELAQRLLARGKLPAVLSRGYGASARGVRPVSTLDDAAEVGDEPLLIKRRVPAALVLVCPDRAQGAAEAARQGAHAALLDDGLQHHALERDLDVVVVDASNPLGNGRLLPRGPLRELPAALGRVRRGLLWLTRCDQASSALPAQVLEQPWARVPVRSVHAPRSTQELRGRRVFLHAAIARPDSFVATVRGLGADIAGTRFFRDHARLTRAQVASIRRDAGDALVVTTEKDAVRLPHDAGFLALGIDLRILEGEERVEAALSQALAGAP